MYGAVKCDGWRTLSEELLAHHPCADDQKWQNDRLQHDDWYFGDELRLREIGRALGVYVVFYRVDGTDHDDECEPTP